MPSNLSRAAAFLSEGGGWPPDVRPSDIDVRQAEALRDSLTHALRSAPPARIIQVLTALMLHYPRPDFTQEQAKAVCLDMAHDFRECPPDIFEQACRDWRQTEKWFPRTAELLAKANALLTERKDALADVNRVLARLKTPPKQGDNFTEADAAEAHAKLRSYLDGLKSRCQADAVERDVGANDYANPVRPWQRPGWKGASA